MSDFTDHGMNDDDLDLGEEADVVAPDDHAFNAWLAAAAPAVNDPPATPSDVMWTAIQAQQRASSAAGPQSDMRITPLRPRARWMWPAAVAAALLVGVGVDRLSVRRHFDDPASTARRQPASSTTVPSTTVPRDSAGTDPAGLYRLAAVQTLTQAEALLTAYRASDIASRNPQAARQLGDWGREVLSSTRLLLDSPAGADAQLRPLLNDIELVLVQVIRLSGAPLDTNDRSLIDRAMRDRDLLPRIRTAVPAGVAGAASDN